MNFPGRFKSIQLTRIKDHSFYWLKTVLKLKETFESMVWNYSRKNPCKMCYGLDFKFSSSCTHEKFVCLECERKQYLLHWPYPMKTDEEAIHFLKSAELRTGKRRLSAQYKSCFFMKNPLL